MSYLRPNVWTLVVLVLVLVGFRLLSGQQATLHHQQDVTRRIATEAHRALCTIRTDDVDRLKQTRAYLKAHPDGGRFGVGLLERSIASTSQQVAALHDVRGCVIVHTNGHAEKGGSS